MDTLKKIKAKETELKPLHDRMDEDKDIVYLESFSLTNFRGQVLSDVINVTLNYPTSYAQSIINDLLGAKYQIYVTGNIGERIIRKIERFIDDVDIQADEGLAKRGMPSLLEWLCNHVCIRGPVGVKSLSKVEKGLYKVYRLPVDMRYSCWQFGEDGLIWASSQYWRNAEIVNMEYPKANATGDKIGVIDYWDDKVNEVWVDSQKVLDQENPYGKVPFVMTFPAVGFMLRDKEYLEHDAESLFFMNRKLYDELNRAVSIEQTLGMDILIPPYEQETDDFGAEPDDVPKSGQTMKVKKGERHIPVPRGDIKQSTLAADQKISAAVQMGSINNNELGNVDLDRTAAWIGKQLDIREKIVKPRKNAILTCRNMLAKMSVAQYKTLSKSDIELKVGGTGRKNIYKASDFPDVEEFNVEFRAMMKSKTQEITNITLANAATGILPQKTILRDILLDEDPESTLRQIKIEESRAADPAIDLFDMALRCAEEAEELVKTDSDKADAKKIESMMLTERCVFLLKQRSTPQQPMPPSPPQKSMVREQTPNTGSRSMALLAMPGLQKNIPSGV